MKVAIVYDRVNKWGGAERVLLALHEIFPDAPLYTSVFYEPTSKWSKVFKIKPSFLSRIKYIQNKHEFLAPLMPLAFESFNFDEYDLVISVTSEAAKGIITKPQTKHINYCLTPTRYLWSGYDEYFTNKLVRLISKPVVSYLRKWDLLAAQRPDAYIAISNVVKKRIKKYYSRDSEVVYPPLYLNDKENISNKENIKGNEKYDHDYFLLVSRLVPYKKVDLAIQACNELNLPLIIVGSGSMEVKLKEMAGPTISFTGDISDEELIEYYKNCEALIFPGEEDFGLVMVEALSFGKPVIAYRAGGATEIIDENINGLFFNKQTKDELINALKLFAVSKFDHAKIISKLEKYSFNTFKTEFMSAIQNYLKN